jgi:hypothetical protein
VRQRTLIAGEMVESAKCTGRRAMAAASRNFYRPAGARHMSRSGTE